MRPKHVVFAVIIIGTLGLATYAFVQFQHAPTQSEPKQSSIGKPFVLGLGESKMIGGLQITFADTTYPPEGYDALSLGAEFPDPPGTYYAKLEMEEEGDRHWFHLNELATTHYFHDYEIRFIGAGGDTITLRIDAVPRNVSISEAEAAKKALEVARARGKLLPGMNPLSMTRTLEGLTWIMGMTFGLDDDLTIKIDANTGQILETTTDSCC